MIERIQLLSQFFQKMSICFFASWGCHKIEVTPIYMTPNLNTMRQAMFLTIRFFVFKGVGR